jgi:hypothetical protein
MVETAMCNEIIEMSAAVANQRLVFGTTHMLRMMTKTISLYPKLFWSTVICLWYGRGIHLNRRRSLPIPPVPPA